MDADDEEELLQSMYDDAFSCTRTGEERRWQIAVEGPAADGYPALTALQLELRITPTYPAVPPTLRVARSRGLSDTDLAAILCCGREEAEAAGGEACAYQAVEACRTALASCGGGECPVCFEAFTARDAAPSTPALALDCGHAFHSPCVAPWFESQLCDFLRGVEKDPEASAASQRARAAKAEASTKRQREQAEAREAAEAEALLRRLEAAAREAADQSDGPAPDYRTRIADARRRMERAAFAQRRAARGAAEAAQRLEVLATRAEEARASLRCAFECPVCRSAVARGTAEALLPEDLLSRDGAAARAAVEAGSATGAAIRGGPAAVPTVPDSLRAEASTALRDLLARDADLRRTLERVQERNTRVRAAQARSGGLIVASSPERAGDAEQPSTTGEAPAPRWSQASRVVCGVYASKQQRRWQY